jgi:hypothetical protein
LDSIQAHSVPSSDNVQALASSVDILKKLSKTIPWSAPSKCPVLPDCITDWLGNNAVLFVYEKPSAAYFEKQSYYDTLGLLSHERWTVMEQIHIVLMNHQSQFGFAKFLNTPHYQTLLPDLIAAADNFDGAVGFSFTPKGQTSTQTLLGNNLDGADKLLFDELPFDALLILLQENLKALVTPSGTPRQALYMDFGFTGWQCVSSVSHSPLGLACPVPKPLLDHPAIVKTFEILWELLRTKKLPWLGSNKHAFDNIDGYRNCKFASKISKRMHLVGFRFAITFPGFTCGCHSNKRNSEKTAFSMVPWASKVITFQERETRAWIIGYSRISIDDEEKRMLLHSPYIKGVCNFYSFLSSRRTKFVCPSFVRGKVDLKFAKIKLILNPCHMNPWSYYQPYLYAILQLTIC